MSGRHDAGLCHAQTKNQVVAPQRDVVVAGARRAGLLCIYRTAAEGQERGLEQGLNDDEDDDDDDQ